MKTEASLSAAEAPARPELQHARTSQILQHQMCAGLNTRSMTCIKHRAMSIAAALQIKAASKQAGVSTASMGKFDERLPGERPGERRIGQKGKAVGPVAAAPGQEGKKVHPCAPASPHAQTLP